MANKGSKFENLHLPKQDTEGPFSNITSKSNEAPLLCSQYFKDAESPAG